MDNRWRISEPIEFKHRLIVDTGGRPLFAQLFTRIVPSDNSEGLMIEEEWEDPEDSRWLPAIEEGIAQFVTRRREMGKPVGYTTLVMNRVISHPIDTDDFSVTYHIKAMLQIQFAQHETFGSPAMR